MRALAKTETNSRQLSTASRLADIAERTMALRELSSSTVLLSDDECRALIAACERPDPPPSHDETQDLVRLLIGAYPRGDLTDPDIYLRHMATIFAAYPGSICRDVAMELPRTSKFLPRVSEVREALQEKLDRRRAIAWRAEWMQRERARRAAEHELNRRLEAIPPERREQMVTQMRRGMAGGKGTAT